MCTSHNVHIHHLQTMLVNVPTVANSMLNRVINKSPEFIEYTVEQDMMQNINNLSRDSY